MIGEDEFWHFEKPLQFLDFFACFFNVSAEAFNCVASA
jgi:hypothetical protein